MEPVAETAMADTSTQTQSPGDAPRRRPFWARAIRFLLILAVLGFVGVFALVRGSAYYFAAQPEDAIKPDSADVIIVLSAGLTRDAVGLDPFTSARVERGVALWKQGAAPLLLMSGGVDLNTGLHLSEKMKLAAMGMGARGRFVMVEGNSVSTFENARFTMEVARQEGWRRAIVVTDDFHLLRAWTLFEFWRRSDDMEIVALSAANGRRLAGLWPSTVILLRETLAVPFNVAKIVGQIGLEMIGEGEGRTIR